jgi:hypothetical protein
MGRIVPYRLKQIRLGAKNRGGALRRNHDAAEPDMPWSVGGAPFAGRFVLKGGKFEARYLIHD